ncbi:uncharacterized protein LOC118509842 [Anopheles stephensi]|uniref:uncharacterized protein LOC118509842 n=1 Tax=Anopheles stephensi TaxID=30069 RepID=UPI001658A0B9|nr:uncharacterized protein LOC118509842 [Anopheles stephensi]
MKQKLLLALFLVAAFSTATASPRRTRMAKRETPTPEAQNVTVVDQDTAPPSTGLSDQPVETAPGKESDPELPKDVEKKEEAEADPVVSNSEEPVIVDTAVTDVEEEATGIQSADEGTVSVPQQDEVELAEPETQPKESQSTDKKDSKSFLSLFLNGLGHIKSSIHDLQTRIETFFISSDAVEALAEVSKR